MYEWREEAYKLYKQGLGWGDIVSNFQSRGILPGTYPTRDLREKVRKSVFCLRKKDYKDRIVISSNPSNNVYPGRGSSEWKSNGEYISTRIIEISKTEEDITPDVIIKLHGLDPGKWDIVSYKNNYWQTQQKGGQILDLYQSKLVVSPKKIQLDEDDISKLFDRLDRKYSKEFPRIKPSIDTSVRMLEVNISDFHCGRYYYDDVNKVRYNTDYIINLWKNLIAKIKEKVDGQTFSYIQFVWCNDFFNSDGISKCTTSGTPQDTDIDWQELFNVGVELLIDMIDELRNISSTRITPVHMMYTQSNHDQQVSWYACRFLEAFYKNDPYVFIDSTKCPRKYITYGNTLIGYGHGDNRMHPKNAATIMPVEASDEWSKTKYKEFHLAHLHSEHMIQEVNGVIVRRCSSPTFADMYHVNKGLVSSERKIQLFVYDMEDGLDTIYNIRV